MKGEKNKALRGMRPAKDSHSVKARDFLSNAWAFTKGLHWVLKVLIAAPVVVTGTVAINTMLGTAAAYKQAWIGDLPAANKQWVEKEIGELKLVSMGQELYFCQQQQAIWDQKLQQAKYDKDKGQSGYVDQYIKTLKERIEKNKKIIDELKSKGAPSSQQRCE